MVEGEQEDSLSHTRIQVRLDDRLVESNIRVSGFLGISGDVPTVCQTSKFKFFIYKYQQLLETLVVSEVNLGDIFLLNLGDLSLSLSPSPVC